MIQTLALSAILSSFPALALASPAATAGRVKVISAEGVLMDRALEPGNKGVVALRASRPQWQGKRGYEVALFLAPATAGGQVSGSCKQTRKAGRYGNEIKFFPIRWTGEVQSGQRAMAVGCPGMIVEVYWP